jgi:hypothetical protein
MNFLIDCLLITFDDNKYKICVQDGTDRVATSKVFRNEKGCRSKKLYQFKNSKCIVYSKFVLIFTLSKLGKTFFKFLDKKKKSNRVDIF